MGASWVKVLRLASRDYFHEWLMSGCFVLALAAVLGPMMVLFGLKFGIVGTMVDELIENPHNREVRPVGSGYYDHAWLEVDHGSSAAPSPSGVLSRVQPP